jgi:DNA-binding NarL/FixJ family response regulator
MTIKLVVADGHPLSLFALNTIFSAEADFAVLAQCGNGNQVMQAVLQHQPDVLVLNKELQGKDGMAVLRKLYESESTAQRVLLTAVMDGNELLDAVRWGVRGIVLIDTALELLVPCVRKVYAGGEWLERDSVRLALNKILHIGTEADPIADRLSPHEATITYLVADGYSNKDIARRIDSTEGAVKAYLHRIYLKLNVRGRVDLVRLMQKKR